MTKVSCTFAASDFPIGKSAAHKTATILIPTRCQTWRNFTLTFKIRNYKTADFLPTQTLKILLDCWILLVRNFCQISWKKSVVFIANFFGILRKYKRKHSIAELYSCGIPTVVLKITPTELNCLRNFSNWNFTFGNNVYI